ncbi:MAG: polysaccharide biosynthesis/export family protein [Pseudomonadota bacterium]
MRRIFVLAHFLFGAAMAFSAAAQTPEYTLNPGDQLSISVWGEDDLNRQVDVLPDGQISFPLAGVISVAGKSVAQIETEIEALLQPKIRAAEVNVTVTSIAGNRVFVLGEVNSPGTYVMTSRMNVAQLISLAGGVTTFAKENRIVILRGKGPQALRIPVNLNSILSGDDRLTNYYVLFAGDVVYVP